MLNSDLPAHEKSDARLGDEAQLIVAAGLVTTSWALTVACFHLAAYPSIAHTLRSELASSNLQPKLGGRGDWHALERLPYLNGCVHEAIRLAHGTSTRSPRLAPDTEIRYGDWVIPRNTPVSMTNVHILMNSSIFPDPREFRPDRWIGKPELERFFVPFGKGSRACPGIKYVFFLLIFLPSSILLFVPLLSFLWTGKWRGANTRQSCPSRTIHHARNGLQSLQLRAIRDRYLRYVQNFCL